MKSGTPLVSKSRLVNSRILKKLAEAEQPLPRSLEFYRQILTVQSKSKQTDVSSGIAALKGKTAQRLGQGKPTLTFTDLNINWAELQNLIRKVISLTTEYLSPTPEETEELTNISSDLTLLKKTAKMWFGAGTTSRRSVTKNNAANPLTGSVLQASFYPLLASYAYELLPEVKQDSWYKNYCPICGGSPDFASLDKEQGGRWLLCSRCDAQWLFYRLVCPFCGNKDHDTLSYFTDDNSLYRLYVCDICHRYLKTIDLRKADSKVLLPLERILTLDMDRQAYESKYKAE